MNNFSPTRGIAPATLLIFTLFHPTLALAETSAATLLAPGMIQEDTDDIKEEETETTPENTRKSGDTEQSEAPAKSASAAQEEQTATADAKPAEEKEPEPEPVTIENPDIPSDELKLLIKPFSTEELTLEAGGWFKVVQSKAKEVVELELQVKRLGKQQIQITEQLEALKETEKEPETSGTSSGNSQEKQTAATGDGGEALTPEQQLEMARELMMGLNPEAEIDPSGSPEQINLMLEDFNKGLEAKKEQLTEEGATLREQRTALIDRFNVILDSINATDGIKEDGTDNDIVVPYRRYIKTVTGLNVDIKDTQSTIKVIKKWLTSKEGGKRWLKNIALFIGVLFGFWLLSLILGALVSKALKVAQNSSVLLRNFLVGIVKKATMLVGLVMALAALEVNISPLIAALGAAGFILAFALQGTLSNFASGILMMIYRPFDVGDSIDAGGVSGSVESMSLVSTHIKTDDSELTIVPNNAVWGGNITNSGTPSDHGQVEMSFTLGQADDADTARERLTAIVTDHPKVMKDPAPVVHLDELVEGGMKFVVLPTALNADADEVKWDVTREVKRLFDEKVLTPPSAS